MSEPFIVPWTAITPQYGMGEPSLSQFHEIETIPWCPSAFNVMQTQ